MRKPGGKKRLDADGERWEICRANKLRFEVFALNCMHIEFFDSSKQVLEVSRKRT